MAGHVDVVDRLGQPARRRRCSRLLYTDHPQLEALRGLDRHRNAAGHPHRFVPTVDGHFGLNEHSHSMVAKSAYRTALSVTDVRYAESRIIEPLVRAQERGVRPCRFPKGEAVWRR